MREIIERLKAATGPDRIADALIYEAVELPRCEEPDCLPDVMAQNIARMKAGGDDPECPAYTSSLDAAHGLIPDGLFWMMGYGKTREAEPLGACAVLKPGDLENMLAEVEAATVPLAICIAALTARQSQQKS